MKGNQDRDFFEAGSVSLLLVSAVFFFATVSFVLVYIPTHCLWRRPWTMNLSWGIGVASKWVFNWIIFSKAWALDFSRFKTRFSSSSVSSLEAARSSFIFLIWRCKLRKAAFALWPTFSPSPAHLLFLALFNFVKSAQDHTINHFQVIVHDAVTWKTYRINYCLSTKDKHNNIECVCHTFWIGTVQNFLNNGGTGAAPNFSNPPTFAKVSQLLCHSFLLHI